MNSPSPSTKPVTLYTFHERERALLAAYAFPSRDTQGRRHPEPEHPYRGPFQRDRDRIVHSAAFRRLSGKMQVFTGDMGDYHRTRLTHTMEVASIARTIGRALRLNEDLIEALALMHDIGHPPFGHAGEDALAEVLQQDGGFSHNAFALTLVEVLEIRYHPFPGLNLSAEVLEGQRCRVDKEGRETSPLLEVQVVDMADSIAYDAHDVDDAVKLRLVELDNFSHLPLIADAAARVRNRFGELKSEDRRAAIVHALIDRMVTSVLQFSAAMLEQGNWTHPRQACEAPIAILPEADVREQKQELERFLYQRVYRHRRLLEVRERAQAQLRELVEFYADSPDHLPRQFQARADQGGLLRSAAEYVAGMTDRFCSSQYVQHVGNKELEK